MSFEKVPIRYRHELRSGRDFAARKTQWYSQIAQDRKLPPSALLVAMALPRWLNAKTEEAFPAQATVADFLGLTTRAVHNGFQALVRRGHLSKKPGKRGYHGTNIYKMEVEEFEIVNGGSSSPEAPSEMTNGRSGPTRTGVPKDDERAFGQTIEETNKRTNGAEAPGAAGDGDAGEDAEKRVRVTGEGARNILQEIYGPNAMNESGHIRR
ncbi:MAG: hypothetical protein HUJ27_09725 [Rhodobacteraceae bacterium]|nr:hypothetical protein [Paracoccaceae bacterium]